MRKFLVIVLFLFNPLLWAQDGPAIVAVGTAGVESSKIAFLNVANKGQFTSSEIKAMEEFMLLLSNNFSFYKKDFEVVSQRRLRKASGIPDYVHWKDRGFSFIAKIHFEKKRHLFYRVEGYSILKKRKIFQEKGRLPLNNLRNVGHTIAHKIYVKLTGRPTSIFGSKILFVSDIASTASRKVKELYIMDFDGANKRRLTHHRGIVISPAISPNRRLVLYSLIVGNRGTKRNVNLYTMDLKTRKSRLVSSRPGINSGAVFMPDGKSIMLTLSYTGNAEIFIMNLATGRLRRVTRHYAPDVDPSINRLGNRMAFLSGRSGNPMIYTADPRGVEKGVVRVSYVGQFNATPRFSPDGKTIAFSSWLDNRFDIFRIDADGRNLGRLTKDFGSNEDPTWSGDGRFIAFSSQRVLSRTRAVKNIYIMDRDGTILGNLGQNFGNCITPRWSK